MITALLFLASAVGTVAGIAVPIIAFSAAAVKDKVDEMREPDDDVYSFPWITGSTDSGTATTSR